MTDDEIMRQLAKDAEEYGLEFELECFIDDHRNLLAYEIDEQFRKEWGL